MSQGIIFINDDGSVSVFTPAPNNTESMEDLIPKIVPKGITDIDIIDLNDIPSDKIFRAAWRKGTKRVDIDILAAVNVAHGIRRVKRGEEFIPIDGNIPNMLVSVEVEAQRVIIRDKYAGIQTAFDNVNSVNALKGLMIAQGWID